MDLKHFQEKLREKQRESQASLAAFEAEEQVVGDDGARDSTDDATIDQGTSEAFAEGTIVSQTLEEVEDALQRIKDGTMESALCADARLSPPAWKRSPGRLIVWKIRKSGTKPAGSSRHDCGVRTPACRVATPGDARSFVHGACTIAGTARLKTCATRSLPPSGEYRYAAELVGTVVSLRFDADYLTLNM